MLHFIVNPSAMKKRKTKHLLEKIEERLSASGAEYKMWRTEKIGDSTAFAREITATPNQTVVAIGGDGMLNDVLSGIVDVESTTLGLIPAGTGNDFASSANIPMGVDALELILTTEAKHTDFLQFDDGKRSMNIAGIGLDVDILLRCEKMKLIKGKIKYFFGLLGSLFKYRGTQMTVEQNGETHYLTAFISAVCNGKQLGGGIPLCPPAKIDDGKMELVVVEYPKRSQLLGALIKLMKGKIFDLPFAHRFSCERAVITPETPCIAQYDGELYHTEALATTLVSGKLRMYRGE